MRFISTCILLITMCFALYAEDIRVACVGNSITSGSGNPKTDLNTYPAQLDVLLGEGYNVQNFGVSGRTMLKNGDYPWWNETAFPEALEFQPHIVTILLGTNDSKPWCWEFKDEFIPDYIAMIDTFRSLDSKPEIYVGLPPPAFSVQWGINDSTITADIIPKIHQVAEEKQTPVIDFYTPFTDKNELFPDDIHPNVEGCWMMAKVIYKKLTGNEVQEIVDVNAALNKAVITPKSSAIPGYLVDGDRSTYWPCDVGESVDVDLGSAESIDMFQVFFHEKGDHRYRIEASTDNLEWAGLVDRSAGADSIQIGVDQVATTEARYIRFTLVGTDEGRQFVQIAELRALKTAPVHAPVLSYIINRISTSYVRFDLIITSTIPGGCLRYFSASEADVHFSASTGYRAGDADTIRVTIRPDAQKFYFAKFYKEGFEVGSDTLKLDYSISDVDEAKTVPPDQYRLGQNYPNPFNPMTTIEYTLPAETFVTLSICDLLGRHVRSLNSGMKSTGSHRVVWDGSDDSGRPVTSGVYLYSLQTARFKETKKLLLIK